MVFRRQIVLYSFLLANTSLYAQSDSAQLASLVAQEWEFRLQENPLLATYVGVRTYDDRLPDVTEVAEQRRARFRQGIMTQLAALDPNNLSDTDRINYEFLRFMLANDTARVAFRSYLVPIDAEGGFHSSFVFAMQRMPLNTVADYEHYLARLRAFGNYADQHITLMKTGLAEGIVSPRRVATNALASVAPYITDTADTHPLYRPLLTFPKRISPADQERLRDSVRQSLRQDVIPAMRRLQTFLRDTYVPQAPEAVGVSAWPRGREFYAQQVRYYTTLPLSPEQVFARGEQEVARIQTAMQSIIDSLGFAGSFADFLEFLRTDPRFYADTPEALLKEASRIAKEIDGKLPQLFSHLPRLPYGVEPVPDELAPTYTVGRYVAGSPENHRAGTYWVNTYQLDSRPLYALPALTLHEAVPGHHLQIALAQEMTGVPEFRRHSYLSAYGEGWGLYAESLGEELGIYQDLYQQFGRLTYEMWRACRLVIDVGIHAKGWTRDRAVQYMTERTALSPHEINTEVDRYIGWPAQALSYKIGELKIQELRQRAEAALGDDFDIREFHRVVLQNGSVPLFVLEKQVEAYMATPPASNRSTQ